LILNELSNEAKRRILLQRLHGVLPGQAPEFISHAAALVAGGVEATQELGNLPLIPRLRDLRCQRTDLEKLKL
jgi:hypothetical protein